MSEVVIRECEPGDVEAIQAIYAYYVLHSPVTFEEEIPDLAEMLRRRDALLAAGYPYLVAQLAGEILGYSYASSYRPRSAYRLTVEDSIYVRPGATGRGVGNTLLSALIDRCRVAGFKQMVAVIGGRAEASIALHERLGFRLVGHLSRVGYKFGVPHDSTIMERALAQDPERGMSRADTRS